MFINLSFITTLVGSIGLAVGIGAQAKQVVCKRLHGHALDYSLSLFPSLPAQRQFLRLSLIPGKMQDGNTGLQIRWWLDWQGVYSFISESISSICNEQRHCSGLGMKSKEKTEGFCVDHSTASIEDEETCPNCPMVPECRGPLSQSLVTCPPCLDYFWSSCCKNLGLNLHWFLSGRIARWKMVLTRHQELI